MDRRFVFAGLALMLLGAAALAPSTFGFSSITADRTTNVETAQDPNALLGIDIVSQTVDGDNVALVEITNNADTTLDITTNAAVTGADRVQITNTGNGSLAPNTMSTVEASCSGTGNPNQDGALEMNINAVNTHITIDKAPQTIALTVDCNPGGGPGNGNGGGPGNGNGGGGGGTPPGQQ